MPRFSRKLQKFTPQKQFRLKNAASNKTGFYASRPARDLHLFLEYDVTNQSVSNSADKGVTVAVSTPTHDFTNGPNVDFPTKGAGVYKQSVDQKLTITGLTDTDLMPMVDGGFLVAGWIYLKSYDADGSGSNNGSCIISGAGLFDVFVNNTGNLGVRFYGAGANASEFKRISTPYVVPLNEWKHFVIYVDGLSSNTAIQNSVVSGFDFVINHNFILDHTRILIDGDSKPLTLAQTSGVTQYNYNSPNAKTVYRLRVR